MAGIIDAYAYYGVWPHWPAGVSQPDELIRILDRVGIERAVVGSIRSVLTDCPRGNAEVAELAQAYPDRIIPFAVLNLGDIKEANQQIDWCLERGFKGFRLYPLHHGYQIELNPLVDRMVAQGLPIVLPLRMFMNWGLPTLPVQVFVRLAERYPHATLILGGVNYGELAVAVETMRICPNTYLEVSCLSSYRAIPAAVDRVGADRILLGTGLALQYPLPGILKVQQADIPEESRQAILGSNARQILGLRA